MCGEINNYGGNEAQEIVLETGETIRANQIISTCGIRETELLLGTSCIELQTAKTGNFSIIESIRVFDGHPEILAGMKRLFFSMKLISLHMIVPKKLLI